MGHLRAGRLARGEQFRRRPGDGDVCGLGGIHYPGFGQDRLGKRLHDQEDAPSGRRMSIEELGAHPQAPVDTAPGELVAAWERRRSGLAAALAQGGNAKPVKLRLQQELRRCEEGAGVVAQLRVAADIARYLAELEAERGKPAPARATLRLCLDKAKPLLNELPEGELRFEWEKRWASAEESVAAKQPPLAVVPRPEGPSATGDGDYPRTAPAGDRRHAPPFGSDGSDRRPDALHARQEGQRGFHDAVLAGERGESAKDEHDQPHQYDPLLPGPPGLHPGRTDR